MVGAVERALGFDVASERRPDDVVEMIENCPQFDAPWVARIIGRIWGAQVPLASGSLSFRQKMIRFQLFVPDFENVDRTGSRREDVSDPVH
jgi:hypothetical protein